MMQKSSSLSLCLLAALVSACVLPVAANYFLCVVLLGWLIYSHFKKNDPQTLSAQSFNEDLKFIFKPITCGLFVYCGMLILSSFFALIFHPVGDAPIKNLSAIGHLLLKTLLLCLLMQEGVARLFSKLNENQKKHLSLTLAVVFGIHLLYLVAQRYSGIDWSRGLSAGLPPNRMVETIYRVSGFMSHPLTLGYNLSLLLFMTFSVTMFMHRKPRVLSKNWLAATAITAVALLLTLSRGSLLAAGCGLVVSFVNNFKKNLKWMLLFAASLVTVLWAEGSFLTRFSETIKRFSETADDPRLTFWRVHWQMFQDHPIVGAGYIFRKINLRIYYEKLGLQNFPEKFNAHNIFLQTLADGGILGMIGLMAFLASFFVASRRLNLRTKKKSPALLMVAVGLVVGGLTQNTIYDTEYLYALWVTTSFVVCYVLNSSNSSEEVA